MLFPAMKDKLLGFKGSLSSPKLDPQWDVRWARFYGGLYPWEFFCS